MPIILTLVIAIILIGALLTMLHIYRKREMFKNKKTSAQDITAPSVEFHGGAVSFSNPVHEEVYYVL